MNQCLLNQMSHSQNLAKMLMKMRKWPKIKSLMRKVVILKLILSLKRRIKLATSLIKIKTQKIKMILM